MDDSLGQHRRAFDELTKSSKDARRVHEASTAIGDAFRAFVGSSAVPINLAMELMCAVKRAEDINRSMIGPTGLALKSVLSQLAASPSWLDMTLAITNPPWMKAVESLVGIGRSQRVFEDVTKEALAASQMFHEYFGSVSAINHIIKPALEAQQAITEVFGRLGLKSAQQLRDMYEPAGFRALSEALERIQLEQSAFNVALSRVTSPFAAIDWNRMWQLVDQTAAYVEQAGDLGELSEAWGLEDISDEEHAEFAEAMRPVVDAVEGAVLSPDRREEKQAEAITAIFAYCEHIVAKLDEQDKRLNTIDTKLASHNRTKGIGWVIALLLFLQDTGLEIYKDWLTSHTTRAINQVLGLLDEPVSSAKQPSAIRRDAAQAVAETPMGTGDARHLRVVTRTSLSVYASPAASSPCIHRLRSGQIVAIVRRDKKWRLVEWFDRESGEFTSGWVRAKYISKICAGS